MTSEKEGVGSGGGVGEGEDIRGEYLERGMGFRHAVLRGETGL